MSDIPLHWADVAAKRVIAEKGNKDSYVCAAGITPSGTVHIGNFREIITVDLVVRAFKSLGKKVRFIYSWDDYDVFRKVPKNMPMQEILKDNLRKPIVDVPDPYNEYESYARHHEVKVEQDVARVGIKPEFLYQAKKYRAGDYVEGIKLALQKNPEIIKILDKYRTTPLPKDWLPISGYCPKCSKDEVSFSDYDGNYGLKMSCSSCGTNVDVDLKKAPFVKLKWRIDWPMRWAHEKVDFEPGGKDHSAEGGSFSTGKEIVSIYEWTAPSYQRYDFIIIKGVGGKMSSSAGNVITLRDCLEVYEPAMVRWLFAGTRPTAEFAISFDLDVFKNYEDFDKLERIYYDKEEINKKKAAKQKRIYEMSCVDKPAENMPYQASFRHLTNILLINELDVDKTVGYYKLENEQDIQRVKVRAGCAKTWIEKYAPEGFKFNVQTEVSKELQLSDNVKAALKEVAKLLKIKSDISSKDLHNQFYSIAREKEIKPKDLFQGAYNVLILKDKGPQLASFILTIGTEKVIALFNQL